MKNTRITQDFIDSKIKDTQDFLKRQYLRPGELSDNMKTTYEIEGDVLIVLISYVHDGQPDTLRYLHEYKPSLLETIKSHLKQIPVSERLHPDFKIVLSVDANDKEPLQLDLKPYTVIVDHIQTKHFDFYNPVKAGSVSASVSGLRTPYLMGVSVEGLVDKERSEADKSYIQSIVQIEAKRFTDQLKDPNFRFSLGWPPYKEEE